MKKKIIILFSINILLIISAIACLVSGSGLKKTLPSQEMSARWGYGSDISFAQVSCFMPVGSEMDESAIFELRKSIDSKLLEASIDPPETGSLYTDAYSTSGKLTAANGSADADVDAIGVGGSFFLFHPLRLRGGCYITHDDLMQDRAVLDEQLAWRLYGSYDIAGMEILINDVPHVVAGVVQREQDSATKKALTSDAGIYVSFETMTRHGNASGISTYEIVMPNPISGFALDTVQELMANDSYELIENSNRFDASKLFRLAINFGERGFGKTGIAYPYWENAARVVENYTAALLSLAVILALFPAVCLVILLAKGRKALKLYIRRLRAKLLDCIETRREKRWLLETIKDRQLGPHFKPSDDLHAPDDKPQSPIDGQNNKADSD